MTLEQEFLQAFINIYLTGFALIIKACIFWMIIVFIAILIETFIKTIIFIIFLLNNKNT